MDFDGRLNFVKCRVAAVLDILDFVGPRRRRCLDEENVKRVDGFQLYRGSNKVLDGGQKSFAF